MLKIGVPDYTLVLGVDHSHLRELEMVLPTWKRNKPSLFKQPWVVFYDKYDTPKDVLAALLLDYHQNTTLCPWPPEGGVFYENDTTSRFGGAQRYKMLSGFVHVPAGVVQTPYWLKLDLDVVATGQDDWINPDWFIGSPGIIAQSWPYTKPADQMVKLDAWVASHASALPRLANQPPVNLVPPDGWSMVRHKRIISWCGFFNTEFTRDASSAAHLTCGFGKLPVPSQDGYLWYFARRGGFGVTRTDMKRLGWQHCSKESGVAEAVNNQQPVVT